MKLNYFKKDSILDELSEFSNRFGLDFSNFDLLVQAFTHSSFSNEHRQFRESNERLEYLGDSVLGLIVNEYLYYEFREYLEGELAKIKSFVVSEPSLASIARDIQLGKYLLLSKGEEQSGGRHRDSLLADALEALIAAVYIDKGIGGAKNFILKLVVPIIQKANKTRYKKDYKSHLQEIIQKKFGVTPLYKIVSENGPDHLKSFTAKVFINEAEYGEGSGVTKKKAEQNAAKRALERE